jgi:hypothetical protein
LTRRLAVASACPTQVKPACGLAPGMGYTNQDILREPNAFAMGEIQLHRRIVPWGNGYGIRVSKGELERLGLRPRDEAEVVIRGERSGLDLSRLHPIDLGRDAAERHDDILGEGLHGGP